VSLIETTLLLSVVPDHTTVFRSLRQPANRKAPLATLGPSEQVAIYQGWYWMSYGDMTDEDRLALNSVTKVDVHRPQAVGYLVRRFCY